LPPLGGGVNPLPHRPRAHSDRGMDPDLALSGDPATNPQRPRTATRPSRRIIDDEVHRAGATYLLGRMILIAHATRLPSPHRGRANVPKTARSSSRRTTCRSSTRSRSRSRLPGACTSWRSRATSRARA
jgi:hypothetical protein